MEYLMVKSYRLVVLLAQLLLMLLVVLGLPGLE